MKNDLQSYLNYQRAQNEKINSHRAAVSSIGGNDIQSIASLNSAIG